MFYSIILSYCVFCDSKYMWMLTFNVSWGTRAFYSKTSCDFFSFFFSQSNRPTQYQETHLTLNEKKGGWPYAFVVYEPAEQNFHIPCMSRTQNRHKKFFSLVAFLLHLTVSLSQRSYESTSNIAGQFSYQWNWQCAILPQTQIHMYANLVEQNLILTLSWSLCLYFFKSCFLLGAVSEKYSHISLATLLKIFVWPRTFPTISLWLERKRNSLICCRIQQKIHETRKICLWPERIRSWHKEFAYLLYNSTEYTWNSQNLAS